ncbi:isocitrate lyase/phosphoenolpyruvate mutase family protein [Tomitella biformata]|nr:isocitrate lyase/phosphoenolpyruvate mutase family protein [Tomitella biformata]
MTTFRDLHHANTPLQLPNAWDGGRAMAATAYWDM